jgi:hypothetical protein
MSTISQGQVGTALKRIFQGIGINPKAKCNCSNLAKKMDGWGIQGCIERRTRIVNALKDSQKKWSWSEQFAAAIKVASSSLLLKVARHPFNPLMGILDEAIEQAEVALANGVILYPLNEVKPFTDRITRNLIYFIFPVKGPEWRRNVEQILQRRHLFNGTRVVAIATQTDGGFATDPVEDVIEALKPLRAQILTFQNHIGEVVAFHSLLKSVESLDANQITYYAHAKGVTKQGNPGLEGAVQKWTNAMHETLLDGIDEVEDILQSHAFAGAYRATGRPFKSFKQFYSWHYPGTFYWFRNSDVFSLPHWPNIKQGYYGTEMWPGTMVPIGQSMFMLADHVGLGPLYYPDQWDAVSQPQLEAWRARRAGRKKSIMHQTCYEVTRDFIDTHLNNRPTLSIADVGAYDVNGTVRPMFARDGWTYTGLDMAAGPNVDTVVNAPYDWSNVPSASFDVVVSLNTVEHVPQPWKWIKEVARICKPGGLVFLCVPNTIPYHAFPVDCWRLWPDGMRGLMEEGGLEVVSTAVSSNDTIGVGRKPA